MNGLTRVPIYHQIKITERASFFLLMYEAQKICIYISLDSWTCLINKKFPPTLYFHIPPPHGEKYVTNNYHKKSIFTGTYHNWNIPII